MKKISYLVLTLTIISAVIANSISNISINEQLKPDAAIMDNSDWHTDDNVTTSDYKVSYEERAEYNPELGEMFHQIMKIEYLDGTEVMQGISYVAYFNDGGIDLENNQVVDWGKFVCCNLMIFSQTQEPGEIKIESKELFQEFMIFKGNITNLRYMKEFVDGTGPFVCILPNSSAQLNKEPVSSISFTNCTCKIGPLTIMTSEYIYNDTSYNAVNTKFDLEIIGTMTNGSVSMPFPAVVSYEFNHNVTESKYKRSVNMDWSSTKDFPMRTYENQLKTNDSFFIVEHNLLMVFNGSVSGSNPILQFEASEDNATAIYTHEGKEVCRQYMPKTFNITGGNAQNNVLCTHNYFLDGHAGNPVNGSDIFTVYDGFKYNNSTGLIVDPEVIIPCYLQNGEGDGVDNNDIGYEFSWIITLASIGITIIIIKFKKQYQFTTQP